MNLWKITVFACLAAIALALMESGKEEESAGWERSTGG